MALEILPCIVETDYQVLTYESLRVKREEARTRKNELIKNRIEENYINDFIEGAERIEGDVCGDCKRLELISKFRLIKKE